MMMIVMWEGEGSVGVLIEGDGEGDEEGLELRRRWWGCVMMETMEAMMMMLRLMGSNGRKMMVRRLKMGWRWEDDAWRGDGDKVDGFLMPLRRCSHRGWWRYGGGVGSYAWQVREIRVCDVRVSFISSLDFFSLKTSSSSSILETLTQYNNYENIFSIIIIFGPSCSQVYKSRSSTFSLLLFIKLILILKNI